VELLTKGQRDIGRGSHEAIELANAETPVPNVMAELRFSNPRVSTSHCDDTHTHAVSNL
jgi:hypothetical protein